MEPYRRDSADGLSEYEREICQAIDSGLSDRAAYRKVDPFSKASDQQAANAVAYLRRLPHCAAYLAALKAKALERHQGAKDRIVAELAAVAFGNVGDFLMRGPDGLAVRPMDDLPPEQLRAVSAVTITRGRAGGSVRLKMHDKLPALRQLCKLFGVDEAMAEQIRAAAHVAGMSDIEKAQRLAAILRPLYRQAAGDPDGDPNGAGAAGEPSRDTPPAAG